MGQSNGTAAFVLFHLARPLVLAGCAIFGTLLALAGVFSSLERYRTESWAASEAVVTRSEVAWSLQRGIRNYYPLIEVRYAGGGDARVAVAHGRWLGWSRQIRENASLDVARYPVGRTVTVYHPPGNTRRGVLERHPWTERIFLLPLGLLLVMVSVRVLSKDGRKERPT